MPYRPALARGSCSPGEDPDDRVDAEIALLPWQLERACPALDGRRLRLASTPSPASGSAAGCFFAQVAAREAASVPAFAALACELRALGAPAALQYKVRQAIDDEFDHAARMTALAERFDAKVRAPVARDMPLRDRLALALDNVIEGCVRESFGALLASYQAAHAEDPGVAEVFARISLDETRHANLAWQLQAWLEAGLTAAQRALVRSAQRAAMVELKQELAIEYAPELREIAGLPDVRGALSLHAELTRALWAARRAAA